MVELKPARVERVNLILDAGLRLALRSGLRATTMQGLAQEAGIAKPTLYSYFPDKNAVFAAITKRLFGELKQLVIAGLEVQQTIDTRVAAALLAKHKAVYRLLEGSPHADEIYSEKSRFAAEEVAEFERWLEAIIADALAQDGQTEPIKYAQLIIACGEGVARRAQYAEQIGPAIRLVCEKLLG